ncbi:LysM peptidoglycan-binding domain-containing protein [Actinomyces sp. ZJ308]|uniref:LysM peptidoglycan-binding domain-containing protein n=1 Tax=Actinomyces sp. ZJ308 TaxID=2708342 RepID=UPI001421C1DB|nr:LysM peptidoglycan-binding domain-containing protein [Actinomyces sp. ZJ308]
MSAIAIPPSPRSASRARARGRVSGRTVSGQAAGRPAGHSGGPDVVQASPRPRLRLVTDDFVPEAPVRHGVDNASRRPAATSASESASMRRPSGPVALRGRRSDLERLAPQHPAVRAARLRDGARRDDDQQDSTPPATEKGAAGPARRQNGPERSGADLRLLRGGSLVVIAAIVLACCGLMVGGLAGLASPSSSAATAQAPARTTTTVVRPGQSLWEIAAASGASDVSGMVTRIVEINDLQDTTVRAGQTLEVPAA